MRGSSQRTSAVSASERDGEEDQQAHRAWRTRHLRAHAQCSGSVLVSSAVRGVRGACEVRGAKCEVRSARCECEATARTSSPGRTELDRRRLRYTRWFSQSLSLLSAEVAELADAQASGACCRKAVKVQILSSAPTFAHACQHRRELRLASQAKVVHRSRSGGGGPCPAFGELRPGRRALYARSVPPKRRRGEGGRCVRSSSPWIDESLPGPGDMLQFPLPNS